MGTIYFRIQMRREKKRILWKNMLAFKDVSEAVVSALSAGYSMENAWREAYRDLQYMYEENTLLMWEIRRLLQKMRMGASLDELLVDWGRRSGVDDIQLFAQVYVTAKRSGGNMIKILRQTSRNICEKMETKREIQTMITAKRLEARCMMVIPLFMIGYLRVSSPDFLNPLYHNAMGISIMSVAFIIYILGVLWIVRIVDIDC